MKLSVMQEAVRGSVSMQSRMRKAADMLAELEDTRDTMAVIRTVDALYNWLVDPHFVRNHGPLEQVLAVTMEELKEFDWKDYLDEEAGEEHFEEYFSRMSQAVTRTEEVQEQKRRTRVKRVLVDEEAAAKMYSYMELNYGRSYLSEAEQKRLNRSLCRGSHADCSLYFTDGILSNMVKKNYQSEYAKRAKSENLKVYGHHMRVTRRNVEILSDTLRRP